MKLNIKLLLSFLSVTVVGVLFMLMVVVSSTQKQLKRDVEVNMLNLTQAAAHEIDRFINAKITEVKIISQADVFERKDPQAMSAFLKEIEREAPYYNEISIFNVKGIMIASTVDQAIGHSFLQHEAESVDYFNKAKQAKQGDIFFKDAHLDEASKALEVGIISPIMDQHNTTVIGVMYAAINLEHIQEVVLKLDQRTLGNKSAYLVNHLGEIIKTTDQHSKTLQFFPDLKALPFLKQALKKQEDGYLNFKDHENEEVSASYSGLARYGVNQEGGWFIISVAPKKNIYAVATRLRNFIILVGFLSLIIATGVAFFVARGISRPVENLVQIVRNIAGGDFTQEVRVDSHDEISELGKAFNSMTHDMRVSRDELITSKDYVDNIIKSMIDTLIALTPDGKIQTINQATLDLLGYQEEELIGKPFGIIIAEEEEEEEEAFIGTRLEKLVKEGSLRNFNITYKTKSGEKIPMSFSGAVMRDKQDKITGIVGVAKDMREYNKLTQQAKAAAAAAAASEKTERQKGVELEKAYGKLKQTQGQLVQAGKMTALGKLGAGIAHELNNPLAALRGYIQLEQEVAVEDSKSKRRLSESLILIGRMGKIIDNIRGFARQSQSEFSVIDLKDPVKNAAALISEQYRIHNIKVDIDCPKTLPKIYADPNQLQQIFINLLSNCRDAIEERRTKENLSEGELAGHIEITAQKKDDFLELSIVDNGNGIPEKIKAQVFDPFYTSKEVGKGTGLGLSITYGLIEDHEGKITFESKVGKGTSFKLCFPAADSIEGLALMENIKRKQIKAPGKKAA